MLHVLRRSRLLALILLLATPSAGGAWLQAAHPCPVDMPWLATGHSAEHPGHGEGTSPAEGCHCVGSCTGASIPVLAAAPVLPPAAAPIPAVRRRLVPVTRPPALRPSDRLPPATAPPLA